MYGDRGNIEIAALWIVFGLLINAVIDGWFLSLNKPDFDIICKKDSICVIESRNINSEKKLKELFQKQHRFQEDLGPDDRVGTYQNSGLCKQAACLW